MKNIDQVLPYGHLTLGDENLLCKWGGVIEDSAKIISENGCTLAVELGTMFGRGAAIMSRYVTSVITIDIFEDVHLISTECGRLHYEEFYQIMPHPYEAVKNNLLRFGNISVVKNLTAGAAFEIDDNKVDLLLVDGDHTFEAVKKDFGAWSPKVKKGGYVIMHDTGDSAHWIEPRMFLKLLPGMGYRKVDSSDCSTVWIKL